jgi:hypothetical protein
MWQLLILSYHLQKRGNHCRAVESIVCQIFSGGQKIIPNESTTGNGIKVASQFVDLGIRIIKQDNRDVPAARNHRKWKTDMILKLVIIKSL